MVNRCAMVIAALGLTQVAFSAQLSVPGQYPTIQSAIYAAGDGDVLNISSGTYHESIDFLGKAITVQPAGSGQVTIDAGGSGSAVVFKNGEQADSVLKGITIRGGSGTSYAGLTVGGGIYIRSAGPTIRDCTIEHCDAGGGGGIGQVNGTATVIGCTIQFNSADEGGTYGGGGVYVKFGRLTLTNCRIMDNQSVGWSPGGGMSSDFGRVTAVNCLIARNDATTWGGGLFNSSGDVDMINCTITDNHAGFSGGGLYTQYAATETSALNSIVWANTAGYEHPEVHDHMDAVSDITFSNVVREESGNYTTEDPMFDSYSGEFHLSSASPYLDFGSNDPWPSGDGHTDLDGMPRLVGSTGPEARVDAGAFEYQGVADDPTTCPPDLDGDGIINVLDLVELLSNWNTSGPGADIADPTSIVDVFDLSVLLDSWGVCPQ